MSHFANSAHLPFDPLSAAATTRPLVLRGRALQQRTEVRERVPLVLAACGSAGSVRRETAASLTFHFALPREEAWSLYWRLVEEGLALTDESHRELTRLCTIQACAPEMPMRDVHTPVLLEIRFPGETLQAAQSAPMAHA